MKEIILCHTIPYHIIPYYTIPYHTIPYHTIPYRTVPYRTVPHRTVPYHTIPYHAIPYYTTPYHATYYAKFKYFMISFARWSFGVVVWEIVTFGEFRLFGITNEKFTFLFCIFPIFISILFLFCQAEHHTQAYHSRICLSFYKVDIEWNSR